jgi:hypothetical protein
LSPLLWLAASSLLTAAHAGDAVAVSADVGGTARYLDQVNLPDPSAFGLTVGARAEVDIKLQARLDLRYMEGKIFDKHEDRFFDVSAAISSPALLFVCADVHEIYLRESSRDGDDLFYVNGGIGFKGHTRLFTLKGGLGVSYLAAGSVSSSQQATAIGGYAGADLMVRTPFVDASARGAAVVAFHDSTPYVGVLADGDLMVKFPVGPVTIGPRLDVIYRNLGVTDPDNTLFDQQQELTGYLGLAVQWGSGG